MLRVLILAAALASFPAHAGFYAAISGNHTEYSDAPSGLDNDSPPIGVAVGYEHLFGPALVGVELGVAEQPAGYIGAVSGDWAFKLGVAQILDKAKMTGLGSTGSAVSREDDYFGAVFAEVERGWVYVRYIAYEADHAMNWRILTTPMESGTERVSVDVQSLQIGYRIRF